MSIILQGMKNALEFNGIEIKLTSRGYSIKNHPHLDFGWFPTEQEAIVFAYGFLIALKGIENG